MYHLKKGKVFYGEEPPSEESTTTEECGGQLIDEISAKIIECKIFTPCWAIIAS